MSEIEFLTLYAQPGDIVVYAGAAPGTHTPQLVEMFPQLSFVLVDPAPFSGKLREGERVRLRQEFFTDEVAQEYAGLSERLLFVSDMRSCDPNIMSNDEVERHVWDDMLAQMHWHNIMRPRRSMLKFRLPWRAGTSEYLDGDIYFPVWGPVTTTETRLVTHENSLATRPYDHVAYEQQMFYFNTRGRVARYQHSVDTSTHVAEGLDYCYDCAAEIHILARYLESGPASGRGVWALVDDDDYADGGDGGEDDVNDDDDKDNTNDNYDDNDDDDDGDGGGNDGGGNDGADTTVANGPAHVTGGHMKSNLTLARQIAALSRKISRRLGGGRTLESTNTDPEERLQFMRNKQWIQGAPAYAPELCVTPGSGISAAAQRMMAGMQFVAGQGLGVHGTGATEPVGANVELKGDTHGIGYVPNTNPLPPAARTTVPLASPDTDVKAVLDV